MEELFYCCYGWLACNALRRSGQVMVDHFKKNLYGKKKRELFLIFFFFFVPKWCLGCKDC